MAIKVDIGTLGLGDFPEVARTVVAGILNSKIALFWGVLLFWGSYFFTDTHDRRFRIVGGFAHATAHLVAAFLLGWLGAHAAVTWLHLPPNGIRQIAAGARSRALTRPAG
jgi:hypothetical protein